MLEFESITRKWGNSIGITLPNDIVEKANIKPNKVLNVLIMEEHNVLEETFGALKEWKKPTKQIMKEIDRELWEDE